MSNVKTREIKTKFSIEGEKQLKSALSENAAQAKELKSEMALLDATFADATDSEEYLAQKAEILAKQIQTAEDKVSLYEDALSKAVQRQQEIAQAVEESRKVIERQEQALEEARTEYGAASEQAQKLNEELEYSKRVLANQENELSKANKAVNNYKTSTNYAQTAVENLTKAQEENEEETRSLRDSVGEITDALGVDLPAGAQQALSAFEQIGSGVSLSSGAVMAGAGLIVAAFKEVVKITNETAKEIHDLVAVSNQFGLNVQTVQAYQYATDMLGVSLDSVLDAQKRMTEIQAEIVDGNEEYIKISRELGVSIYDTNGNLKDAETLMFEYFEELCKVRDEQQRNIYASKLFGDQFTQLNPIIRDGAASFREYMVEAERIGYVVGEEGVAALEDHARSINQLEAHYKGLKNTVAVTSSSFLSDVNDMTRALPKLVKELFVVKDAASEALDWKSLFKMPDLSAYKNLFSGSSKGYAAGTPSAAGGVTTVGEYGPERVYLPKGARVMNARDTAAESGRTVSITVNASVPNLATLQQIIDFYENYEVTRRMR